MATATVARATNALRQRRTDAPRLSLGKRINTSNIDGSDNGQVAKRRKIEEPYVRTNDYILKKHKGKQPSIVLQLHNNYWKFGGQEGSFGYDSQMAIMLDHLPHGTVPHEILEDLLRENVAWYDGCLIVEVYNHRTAGGNEKGRARDDEKKSSMHAYNEHITPSPMVPYPKKARTDEDAETEDGAGGSASAQENKQKEKDKDGPKIFTAVLHPTELSRHHEMLLLANTPASEMRSRKKGSTDTTASAHPVTPSLSVPPTPPMTSRGPLTKDQRMCLEDGELNTFMADVLVATQPPLYLDPVDNPQDAQRVLDLLSHPLHKEKPPLPKTRKRTTAEMAADDAQAAEAERRMLIMDERIKPSARTGAGAAAESNQGPAASLGFSRFKTLEMVRQKYEENQLVKKEEADRAALEKKQQDEQNAVRQQQMLHQQKQREMLQAQQMQQGNNHTLAHKQALLRAQHHQLEQQRQAQMAAVREQHAHPNAAANAMMQAQQQQQQANFQHPSQNMAMQSSPVMQQHTPSAMMNNSSPMMPNGGFPVAPTSSQGAGSPPRPTSAAMHNRNVQMARQASQQHPGSQNNTPQIPQGTPSMAQAIPNRQMTQTPRMLPGSPAAGMQGTPNSTGGLPMNMPTPHMQMAAQGGHNLTQEQIMMLQQQQRNLQQSQASGHAGSPAGVQGGGHNMQNLTPEQLQQIHRQNQLRQQQAIMHAQQQQAQAQGQQITPQQQQNLMKMQIMRRQQVQLQQMQAQQQMNGMNGAAGSPMAPQQGHMQPTPTPQMAHAHPQTPQQHMQQQQGQMNGGGGGQPGMDFQQHQMAIAQHRAQAIAAQRQAQAQLQQLSRQYGGNLSQVPASIVQALPGPARQMLQQQVAKQAEQRGLHQMRAQQQAQQQMQQVQQQQQNGGGGGGGVGAGGDGVVPAAAPNPGYMQQLRQNQALLAQQMQMQQAQGQVQNGGMGGMNGGMNGMNMAGQSFGVGGGQQAQGPGDLTQHFVNMQNALSRGASWQGGQ